MSYVRLPPTLPPRFDEASQDVLTYLRGAIPIGTWTVTRYDGERQIYLTVDDTDLGLVSGDTVAWSDSICQYTSTASSPTFVSDTQSIPEYAAVVQKSGMPVHTYVGYPLTTSDGMLFGTLCGFGRDALPAHAENHEGLIVLLASLLSRILEADLQTTAIARALEAAQRSADTDSLTGLVNRNGWQRLLDAEEDRFRRFGDPGAVIVVDLDELKAVNDSLGHHAGDDRLRQISRLMSDVVDVPGVIARLGGDEFAILLSNVKASTVDDMMARLRAILTQNGVSASVGYSLYSMSNGLDGAWRAADAAMYSEKVAKRPARVHPRSRVDLDG